MSAIHNERRAHMEELFSQVRIFLTVFRCLPLYFSFIFFSSFFSFLVAGLDVRVIFALDLSSTDKWDSVHAATLRYASVPALCECVHLFCLSPTYHRTPARTHTLSLCLCLCASLDLSFVDFALAAAQFQTLFVVAASVVLDQLCCRSIMSRTGRHGASMASQMYVLFSFCSRCVPVARGFFCLRVYFVLYVNTFVVSDFG